MMYGIIVALGNGFKAAIHGQVSLIKFIESNRFNNVYIKI